MSSILSPTVTVDLSALTANYNALNKRCGGGCGAVVKADAYGVRAHKVVKTLSDLNVQDFFVATKYEATQIHYKIPDTAQIHILNSERPEPSTGRTPRASAVANSIDQLINHFDRKNPAKAIHIDTGMNRLGIAPEQVGQIPIQNLADGCLIMSHFVEAEVPGSPTTAAQIKLFRDLYSSIRSQLPDNKRLRTSLANSAGMFVDGAKSDVPRPGYALYGGNPTPWTTNPMTTVARLDAPIVQVRRITAGERVGYNGTWVAPTDRWIATIGVGYADGWLRTASGNAVAGYNGHIIPIVGRISMDSMTLDFDQQAPSVGDIVTLMDGSEALNVEAIAQRANTIGYEVLTSLGNRLNRRYV